MVHELYSEDESEAISTPSCRSIESDYEKILKWSEETPALQEVEEMAMQARAAEDVRLARIQRRARRSSNIWSDTSSEELAPGTVRALQRADDEDGLRSLISSPEGRTLRRMENKNPWFGSDSGSSCATSFESFKSYQSFEQSSERFPGTQTPPAAHQAAPLPSFWGRSNPPQAQQPHPPKRTASTPTIPVPTSSAASQPKYQNSSATRTTLDTQMNKAQTPAMSSKQLQAAQSSSKSQQQPSTSKTQVNSTPPLLTKQEIAKGGQEQTKAPRKKQKRWRTKIIRAKPKKKDVVRLLYNAEDVPSDESDAHSQPEEMHVKDEPEDNVVHCTLSSVSVHKTEEDMAKEQDAWGVCKKCTRRKEHYRIQQQSSEEDESSDWGLMTLAKVADTRTKRPPPTQTKFKLSKKAETRLSASHETEPDAEARPPQ